MTPLYKKMTFKKEKKVAQKEANFDLCRKWYLKVNAKRIIFKALMKEEKRVTYSDAIKAKMKPTCYTI